MKMTMNTMKKATKNTLSQFKRRGLLPLALVATLAACASVPKSPMLDDARAAYNRAAGDAQVVRSASVELNNAQQSLQKAETAQRSGDDAAVIDHYAYLALKRTESAVQAGQQAQAEQAISDASQQRDRILIDARTRDATSQGKLAQERLAAAQASKAEAAKERARAKSLEEQLAELQAKPTERGMVLTLGDVLFDTGRAELKAGAARTLDQLAEFMAKNPERTVEIEGHTDSVGSDQLNQTLSERRANAVKNALTIRGIASNRISSRGFGEATPVASNNTAAGRQQNRRVEVVISQ